MDPKEVVEIEVEEDFTASARCDEGFLHVRRRWCHNVRADGSRSARYRLDAVDRPNLDAVAVLIHRRSERGLEVLTRANLRPAAHFRAGRKTVVPDGRSHLYVEEIVAGLLEPVDVGEPGVRARAAAETHEEAGVRVSPDEVRLLGGPIFVAPGILSEKIFLTEVDVTGKPFAPPEGDGSPLEEGGRLRWWSPEGLLEACFSGEVQDAKTEVALRRFLSRMS